MTTNNTNTQAVLLANKDNRGLTVDDVKAMTLERLALFCTLPGKADPQIVREARQRLREIQKAGNRKGGNAVAHPFTDGKVGFSIGENGTVSNAGLRGFPIGLYVGEQLSLAASIPQMLDFVREHCRQASIPPGEPGALPAQARKLSFAKTLKEGAKAEEKAELATRTKALLRVIGSPKVQAAAEALRAAIMDEAASVRQNPAQATVTGAAEQDVELADFLDEDDRRHDDEQG